MPGTMQGATPWVHGASSPTVPPCIAPDTAKGKFFYNEPGAGKNARRKDAQPRRRTEFPNVLDYNIDFDYT